jgi:hypothetical protein
MNTFYGKISSKGDALTVGAKFLALHYTGAPHGGYRSGHSDTLFPL